MENRVLFRGILGNEYHGTKPYTFWQKSIPRGKSENHGTKVYISPKSFVKRNSVYF